MAGIVVLAGKRNPIRNLPKDSVDVLERPETLIERLRADSGAVRWVAIAPEVEDPPALARQVQRADPTVSVVLLGDGAAAVEDLRRILDTPASEDDESTEPEDAARVLLVAQRRAFEAEKLAAISDLTASLAHDVATPMTAILGYAELIAKSVGDDKNRKRATTIVEQVSRVRSLIETLMIVSRREDRPPTLVSLAGIFDKAIDQCRERLERRGIEVIRDEGPAPQALADPNRLHQVFLSLLVHASESMSGGGMIRVSVGETETGDAEIRVYQADAAIGRSVSASLFDAPVESGTREIPRRLGLVVARALVEENGGTLDFASEPDRGVEFRLTLPRPP